MSEGSLGTPTRHEIPWRKEGFFDPNEIEAELRRVFDICHGCRRCFNLCDSFPRLFDLIDESESGELDTVDSRDFKRVIDGCTLCDMCFMTKCPYVPPHEFDLDFPHLVLRHRAMEFSQGKSGLAHRQITETDRNGKFAVLVAGLINWLSSRSNKIARTLLEIILGIHKDAYLPVFSKKSFEGSGTLDIKGKSRRKAVLYATCFVNYNSPEIGEATKAVLAKNGIKAEVIYPSCCGMPQLEQGNIGRVAENAKKISAELAEWIGKGYDIIALVPSCAFMLKFEWPLILPENPNVKRLSEATFDPAEYIVDIAKREGLKEGLNNINDSVSLHLACHSRAQNMGVKALEMLRLIPGIKVDLIERCSGHGGSWGVMKDNFDTALKIGQPAARKTMESKANLVVSECPLAREHLIQTMEVLNEKNEIEIETNIKHPIQLLARAYGIK